MEECYFFSNKSSTPPWVFFAFLKLYKWYQIALNITIRKPFDKFYWQLVAAIGN